MPTSSMPGHARPLAHRTSLQAVLLLGSMGVLASLWSDMLFPAMVSIQQDLQASATAVQQTVSLFFVANAFMCLWHGVISDAWGRRKPLLIGLVVLVLTSLLSLLATRIEHLWILRTVQGLVVGLGHVLCRAVIRDLYSGEGAQKMIAHTSLLQTAGPIVLPMLGGWLTWMWGWRALFAFLAAVGMVMLLVYARKLPESLPPERRQAVRLGSLWRNYRLVLGSPWFMRLSVAHACNWAAMYLYVAAGPRLVTHLLGRPPTDVYLVFTPMMVGLIAGFLCLPRVLQRWGTRHTMYLAYLGFAFVSVLNAALSALVPPGLMHLLPIAAYAFAVALSMPLLVGHALHPFPHNAGLAASCQLFLQYSMMAVVAGLLAPLLWDSLWHVALGCAVLTGIGMALLLWQRYATWKAQGAAVTAA
ncbi:multidrug effflux MFS transporter [Variovorax sp. dw_954]|uniref:multidrug effflux MFS transporter n=1 Tax=Variovorax sp. dw_954 TaxID=2720078 RepID=UPI001BD656B1|nr:multidrug effflux MFS transporter [Variovorax sp. dw_954]